MKRNPKNRAGWWFLALFVCVLVASFIVAARAAGPEPEEEPRALFDRANQAYASGDFAQARDLYIKILDAVPNNPTVEYNLGNTYARLDKTALAILYYEKALQSDPGLEDARQNLLRLAPPVNQPEVSPLIRPFRWIKQQMNVNQWLWTTFLTLLVACVATAFWALDFKLPKLWGGLSIAFAIFFLLSLGFSASSMADSLRRDGIVLHEKTVARSGPGDNYIEAMELPAGTKVTAAGEPQRGWIKIRTPDGHAAYVQTADVEWI